MNNLTSSGSNRYQIGIDPIQGIEQHRDYLYHNALGRLRNRELAEDAVHDSFLAALAGADRFSGASSQKTWLTAILMHKTCDQVRRACRDRAVFESGDTTERTENAFSRADQIRDPSAELEQKELREAIQTAVGKLPTRLAKAFCLDECEDCSGREVCAELGISENNLWIMLHRARKQLREQLSPWRSAVPC